MFRRFTRAFTFTDAKGDVRTIPADWAGEVADSVAKDADEGGYTDQSKPPEMAKVQPEITPVSDVEMGKKSEPEPVPAPVPQPQPLAAKTETKRP